jgi:hypothetical protein
MRSCNLDRRKKWYGYNNSNVLIFVAAILMLGINLTVSSQNVNSLNASSELKTNQQQKLSAIVNLKSDIICLCDTRLSNKNNINCASRLASSFEFNPIEPYTFMFN